MCVTVIPLVQTTKNTPLTDIQTNGLILYELLKKFETRKYFCGRENEYETIDNLMLRLNIKKPYTIGNCVGKYTICMDNLFVRYTVAELKFLSKNLDKSLIRLKNKRTQQILPNMVFASVQTMGSQYCDIRSMRTNDYIHFVCATVFSKLSLVRNTLYISNKRSWHSRSRVGYMWWDNKYCFTTPTLLSLFQYTWYNLVISELRKGNLNLS